MVIKIKNEIFWITLGHFFAMTGALFNVRLLTELLHPVVYGYLSLAMTITILINQTVTGPISNGITRHFVIAKEQGDLYRYFFSVRFLFLSAAFLVFIVSICFTIFAKIAKCYAWISVVPFASFFALLSGIDAIINGIQNAARQRPIVAFHKGLNPWMRSLGAVISISIVGDSSVTVLLGYSIGLLPLLFSQWFFLQPLVCRSQSALSNGRNWENEIWHYSWPFVVWGGLNWVYLSVDRWALGLFSGSQQVGLFAILFQLGYMPISQVSTIAMQVFAPIFFERAGDASDQKRIVSVRLLGKRLSLFVAGIVFLSVVVVSLFHQGLFKFLAAEQYRHVSYLLPGMVLSGGCFALGQTIALRLMSEKKTKILLIVNAASAISGIFFSIIFIYFFGIVGAVIAKVAYSIIYVFASIVAVQQSRPECPPMPSPENRTGSEER